MRHLPLLALIVGCPAADEQIPLEEPYTPAPYIYEEDDPPVAELALGDLEGAVEGAVAVVLSLNAAPIFPAYQAAMLGAQETCPAYYDYQGSQYWYDQCTADGGASFSGYSFYQPYENYDAGDGNIYNGDALYGVSEIVTADGYTFSAGGSASNLVATGEFAPGYPYTYFGSVIQGSFAYDGPEAAGTWLADGVAPDLSLAAYTIEQGNYVSVDGGLSGLGGQLDTVVFDTVVLFDAGLGSVCPTEPSGVVSVRDAAGSWYDVVFDGPPDTETEVDRSLCDGCGAAYFRGEPLGDVCVDFGALLAWEVAPW